MWQSKHAYSGLVAILLGLHALGGIHAQDQGKEAKATEKGLLGYWKFDDGRGDVAEDRSGNGNDGDIYRAQWVKGRFGVALRFDGQGSYVSLPEIAGLDGSSEMTLQAWVLWEGTGQYPNIITVGPWNPGGLLMFVSNDQCSFRLGRPGKAAWDLDKGWKETSAPLVSRIALGRWYHLAATFKRPRLQTYLDGRQVGSATWDFPVGCSGEVTIGKWAGAVCHKGLVDEVKIYARALSAQEIKASHDQEASRRAAEAPGAQLYEQIAKGRSLEPPALVLKNDTFKLMLSKRLEVTGLVDAQTGRDYLGRTSTFAAIKSRGRRYRPSAFSYRDGRLSIDFGRSGISADIAVHTRARYFVFEVISVSSEEVEELVFLDMTVKPSRYVSWLSGIAADDEFAFCLRGLNLRTQPVVAGSPAHLRATCSRQRGLKGAKAALVACPAEQIRSALQEAARREGEPYSRLGGPFALDAHANRCSYLFAYGLSESNVDEWIDLARRACVPIIHLCGWYRTRGHYEPRPDLFPRGLASLKAAVDRIHAAGLMAGMHTLTGCIAPGDPFTSPVPDKRLAKDRVFTLAEALGEAGSVVPVLENPRGLDTIWAYASRGNVVQIGDELIQYAGLSEEPPYALTKCSRGAFGTKVQSHKKGSPVSHLHVRYSFQPHEDSTLVDDVAACIAEVANECGFDLIYMDGTEGMPAGWYGSSRMRTAIFNKITRPIRVESSSSGLHHCWPFHSCVGAWDYPQWGLKRFIDIHCESNERYRKSSLMPAQLGWWGIFGPSATRDAEWPDEVEYLCCKALGHDMSLSFSGLHPSAHPPNARQDEYLTMIGRYEKLRLSGYFSESVKAKLRAPRQEFHLVQTGDGEWQFLPTDYIPHRAAGLSEGSSAWTVDNRFAAQRPRLRIQALYGAGPYDGPKSLPLAHVGKPQEFAANRAASGVTCRFTASTEEVKVGDISGCYTAKSTRAKRRGAWTCVVKEFAPPIDLRQYGALGVWIHGDGKGELLNFQLTNLPQYWEGGQTCSEHYVTVDFTGWRYVELLLRERDAERHGDYVWPYRPIYGVYRAGLRRQCVTKLTIYYNDLPPNDEVKCYLSPIRALPAVKRKLVNPSLTVAGRRVVFPLTIESGQYIEFGSMTECRLRDARGALVAQVKPKGVEPRLEPGRNAIAFACDAPGADTYRAKVTVISSGEPLRGIAAGKKELKAAFRSLDQHYLTLRPGGDVHFIRYDKKVIRRLDGQDNVWRLSNETDVQQSLDELSIRVAGRVPGRAYQEGIPLADFEDAAAYGKQDDYARYVVGPSKRGLAKQGVTAAFNAGPTEAKVGKSCVEYRAVSTLADRSGWAAAVSKFARPLDLSSMKGLGLWVKGDGKAAYLKVQLCDTKAGRADHYVRLDFDDWRYVEFAQPAMGEVDMSEVECLVFYLVGLPAKGSSTCWLDDVRALRDTPKGEVAGPRVTIGHEVLAFPVALVEGDLLVFKRQGTCEVIDSQGRVKPVVPAGHMPKLLPGPNPIRFDCAGTLANDVAVTISRH